MVIGHEVLAGKVEEANARFLIRALREEGVRLKRVSIVPDDIEVVASEVRRFSEETTHVLTAGGVGGTHDDITMLALGKAFDRPLETHPKLLALLEGFYGAKLEEAHRRMAELPEGAEVILDEKVRIPVVRVHNVFVLPGHPTYLQRKFPVVRRFLRGSDIWHGQLGLRVTEEEVADILRQAHALHEEVEIGSYPRTDPSASIETKVTIEGGSLESVRSVIAWLEHRLAEVIESRSEAACVGGPSRGR